jgi:hypothetical protein
LPAIEGRGVRARGLAHGGVLTLSTESVAQALAGAVRQVRSLVWSAREERSAESE